MSSSAADGAFAHRETSVLDEGAFFFFFFLVASLVLEADAASSALRLLRGADSAGVERLPALAALTFVPEISEHGKCENADAHQCMTCQALLSIYVAQLGRNRSWANARHMTLTSLGGAILIQIKWWWSCFFFVIFCIYLGAQRNYCGSLVIIVATTLQENERKRNIPGSGNSSACISDRLFLPSSGSSGG